MRELKVTDVENSTLIVLHPDGEEFRLVVDEIVLHRLRGARASTGTVRVSPKDVQAHIRSGMSAPEVAALTGASLDFISRFEGPVLAERAFIVNSALAVATQATVDLSTGETSSAFGALIHSRLREIDASGERWASWKETDGSWVIKLEFVAAEIEHDARWIFEPRKHALSPVNSDAATLSQKGEMTTGIIPRLRALPGEESPTLPEIFDQDKPEEQAALAPVSHLEFSAISEEFTYETNVFVEMVELFTPEEPTPAADDDSLAGTSPTADLLEALRRRRGEREATPAWLRDELSTNAVLPVERPTSGTAPLPLFPELDPVAPPQRTGSHARRDRVTMPSWDEIVFGTRSDDETP